MSFMYSRTWGVWSRLLLTSQDCSVGVQLTGKRAPLVHGPFLRHFEVVDELPADVVLEVKALHGEKFAERLLSEDLRIDWVKFTRVENGGASLHEVLSLNGQTIGEFVEPFEGPRDAFNAAKRGVPMFSGKGLFGGW